MADTLDFKMARELATRLSTIDGFPRFEAAIIATAEDLGRWCKGAFVGGRIVTAEAQADWLVTEAREKWETWQGTKALLTLFRSKYTPEVKPGNGFVDYANMPCVCGSGRKFRDCCQPGVTQ